MVQPHADHPFLLEALLVQWPEKSTALLGQRWSRRPRHPRRATADLPRKVPAPHRATAPVSPVVSHCIHDGHCFPSLDRFHDGGRLHTARQWRHIALSYPCDRPVGEGRGRARPVWLSHWSSGRTTHDVMSCLRHRSPAAGMPAPPRPQRHSCWPTRPCGPRGCRPSATPQAAPRWRIARDLGHELAISSAPCHRRLRAGRCVGMGNHGIPACWGSPADPCRAYPSVPQACRPVPIY